MKKILLTLAAFLLLAGYSCKSKSGDAGAAGKTGKDTTAQQSGSNDFAAMLEKKVEELGKLSPRTREELDALVPASFMGGERGLTSSGTVMGVMQANANYKVNDSTDVYIGISDCAGSAGAGNYSNVMSNLQGQLGQSGDETIEAVNIAGVSGFQKYTASEKRTELWFLGGGRYLITLGGNAPAGDMKKAAAALKFQ